MELNVSIFVAGTLRGSKVVQTPCMIGRSKEAALTVAHPAMSRKHCELYEEGGKLFLRDNSSLNGTLYKGDYVEGPIALEFGDEFVVGELKFKISEPAGPLTREQQELANRPTASFALTVDDTEEAGPGMETILEPSVKVENMADSENISMEEAAPKEEKPTGDSLPKKGGKKISPQDVQIKL